MKAFISFFIVIGLAVQGFAWEKSIIPPGGLLQERKLGQDQSSIAEKYLSLLAEKRKSQRMTFGIAGAIGGGLLCIWGDSLLGQEEDLLGFNRIFGKSLLVGGGACLVGAAVTLAIPRRAEREYARVQGIRDPVEREKISAAALAGLARSAKRSRMIWGGVSAAFAVLYAIEAGKYHLSNGNYVAAAFGGLALQQFLIRSAEEETHAGYLERSRPNEGLDLRIGLAPGGGIWVGFSVEL